MGLDAVIAVVEGDCSQDAGDGGDARGSEAWRSSRSATPTAATETWLRLQIDKLIERLGATWRARWTGKRRLDPIRRKVGRIDELTWQTNAVSPSRTTI